MAEQENNMEMMEFEFPDEAEEKVEKKVVEEPEFEVEDDTPVQDRGREPLPSEIVEELESDELNEYSDRVRTRMAQLKKVWHDERRAKEAAAREREEAIRTAQTVYEENKRLKANLYRGETELIAQYKEATDREIELAKREYRDAYDSGDTDKLLAAQERLTKAQLVSQQVENYRPQYEENALQTNANDVNTQSQRPQVPQPDYKAVTWQERNSWFGSDEEMTSLALGLHEKLVKGGVDPRSDDYYRRIDNTMRKRFPEYEWGDSQEETKPQPRAKQAQVVAPATRSTAPKKVVLTKTQVSLAKKLGITPEQYARELIKENRNG